MLIGFKTAIIGATGNATPTGGQKRVEEAWYLLQYGLSVSSKPNTLSLARYLVAATGSKLF